MRCLRNKWFLIFVTCFTFQKIQAQNFIEYHTICNQAAEQIELGMTIPAKGMLTHALSLVKTPEPIDLFHIAKCFSQENEPDSTLHYLKKSMAGDPRVGKLVRIHYLWFEPVLGKEKWVEIEQESHHFIPREMTDEETTVYLKLKYIDSLSSYYDSTIRNISFNTFPVDTVLMRIYFDSVYLKNEVALIAFDEMVKEYSCLPFSHPNHKLLFSEFIRHIPTEYFEKNEALFLNALQQGTIDPYSYFDFYLSKNYKDKPFVPSYYYTTELTDEKIEVLSRFGVSTNQSVNVLRYQYVWPYD